MAKFTKQDILNLNPAVVKKLKLEDLKKVMQVVSEEANLRVNNLGAYPQGQLSPAYKSAMKRGKPFGTTSEVRNDIMQEYLSALAFINLKTSTIAGWNDTQKQISKFTKNMNNKQLDSFYELFNKFRELNVSANWDWSTVYKICINLYQSNQELSNDEMLDLWYNEIDKADKEEFEDLNDDTFQSF